MNEWTTSDIVLLCVAIYISVMTLVRLMRAHRDKVMANLKNELLQQQRLQVEQELEESKQRKQQEREKQRVDQHSQHHSNPV